MELLNFWKVRQNLLHSISTRPFIPAFIFTSWRARLPSASTKEGEPTCEDVRVFNPPACSLYCALITQGKRARRSEAGEGEGAGSKSSASGAGSAGSPSSSSPPSKKSKPDGENKVTSVYRHTCISWLLAFSTILLCSNYVWLYTYSNEHQRGTGNIIPH